MRGYNSAPFLDWRSSEGYFVRCLHGIVSTILVVIIIMIVIIVIVIINNNYDNDSNNDNHNNDNDNNNNLIRLRACVGFSIFEWTFTSKTSKYFC